MEIKTRLELKTYYRMEFLPLVVSFAQEAARCFGANDKEAEELAKASDEAAAFIIERYPNYHPDEQFEVVCEISEDGVLFLYHLKGT